LRLREKLHLSRGLFARCLRTNVRTLEKWEQGRAKPNAQAALLIELVRQYPDTIERLNADAGRSPDEGARRAAVALEAKLATARRAQGFREQLVQLVDEYVVRIADYPELRHLAWSHHEEYLSAPEAFALYERNWRYVDRDRLEPREAELIRSLTERFGGGIFNG
jgi:transcriptional regulator with XRE-family HTH domain